MHSLHLATVFAGALVCFLASLLLFSRRKEGERSRTILAFIVLFSVANYIPRFIALCNGVQPAVIVSVPMMLLGIFMIISYIMYPIEVIAPGWLNLKRLVTLYFPLLVLFGIYYLTIRAGIEYTAYKSLLEMIPGGNRFEAWFRLFLVVAILATVPVIFFVPYTRKYNNTNRTWIRKYVITLSINIIAYLLVLTFDVWFIRMLYYYVSVGCSLYIVYMELFVRLIGKSDSQTGENEEKSNLPKDTPIVTGESSGCEKSNSKIKNEILVEQLDAYMKRTYAWRDPDLSLNSLASALYTNRTTLAQAIQESGYKNYTAYISSLRIMDFIQLIETNKASNFQEAFFDAGFRSRATALRNFRQITGKIPSEYFSENNQCTVPDK